MGRLDPAIHVFRRPFQNVAVRRKAGHDELDATLTLNRAKPYAATFSACLTWAM